MEVRSCVFVEMADWKPRLRLVRMLWVGCMAVCDDSRTLQGTEERWVGNSWGVTVALFEGTGDVGVRLREGRGDGVSSYLEGTFSLSPQASHTRCGSPFQPQLEWARYWSASPG